MEELLRDGPILSIDNACQSAVQNHNDEMMEVLFNTGIKLSPAAFGAIIKRGQDEYQKKQNECCIIL